MQSEFLKYMSNLNGQNQKRMDRERQYSQDFFKNSMLLDANNRAKQQADIAMYGAKQKGYGQADIVKDVVANATTGYSPLDDTIAMEKLNKAYTEAAVDSDAGKKLVGYVAQLDKAGVGSDKAKDVLGANYNDYIKSMQKVESDIGALNNNIQNNEALLDNLYKKDKTSAISAFTGMLVKKGANPVYAATIAPTLAQNYIRKQYDGSLTDADKTYIKNIDNQIDAELKNTVKIKAGTGKYNSANAKSKKGHVSYRKAPGVVKIYDALSGEAKKLGVSDDIFNFDTENKDIPSVSDLLAKPVKIPGSTEIVYLQPDDVKAAAIRGVKTSMFSSNQLANGETLRELAIAEAQNKIKSNPSLLDGYSGVSGSKEITTNSINPISKKLIEKLRKEKANFLSRKVNASTDLSGIDLANALLGVKNSAASVHKQKDREDKKLYDNPLIKALNSKKGNHAVAKEVLNGKFADYFGELSGKDQERARKVVLKNKDWLASQMKTKYPAIKDKEKHIVKTGSTNSRKKFINALGEVVDPNKKVNVILPGIADISDDTKNSFNKVIDVIKRPPRIGDESDTRVSEIIPDWLKGSSKNQLQNGASVVSQKIANNHPEFDKQRLNQVTNRYIAKFGKVPTEKELINYYINVR